jgi:hypothetical protein
MAAKTLTALAQAHQVALARGDHESAKHFADSAARFAMYYATGNPMLPAMSTAIERAPKKRRQKRLGKAHASKRDRAATTRARRENAALAGAIAVAAVLGMLVLFIAARDHVRAHVNESVMTPGANSHGR